MEFNLKRELNWISIERDKSKSNEIFDGSY